MKKAILMFLAASILPVSAFAHGNKVDMTADSIVAALNKFKTEEASQMNAFVGAKGWVDGAQTMVKVYLTGNLTITYSCTMVEMGNGNSDAINCLKQ